MFGLFKKKSDEAELSASTIIPRIKHLDFRAAYTEMDIPADQQPITEPLVGDLLVTYAFDLPELFAMVTLDSLADLGIKAEELRGIAISNIRKRIPKIEIHENGPILQIVTGESFEACTLLNGRFWDSLADEQESGSLVVSVPHRDLVLACSQ